MTNNKDLPLPEIVEAILDAWDEPPHGEFLRGQCELLARLIEPRSRQTGISLGARTDAIMRAVTEAQLEGASALELALFLERDHVVDMGSEEV